MDPVSEEVLRTISDSLVKNKAEYTKAINQIIENTKAEVNAVATNITNLNDYSSTLSIIPVLNIFNEDKVFNAKKYKTSLMTVKILNQVEGYAKFFEHRRIFRTDDIPESSLEYCGLIDRQLSKAYHDYIINYKSLITDIENAGISIHDLKFYLKNGFIPTKKDLRMALFEHIFWPVKLLMWSEAIKLLMWPVAVSLVLALMLYIAKILFLWLIH